MDTASVVGDTLSSISINSFINKYRESVNEAQLKSALIQLFYEIGTPYKMEDNRIDILTPIFNIEVKHYKTKHTTDQFNQILSQIICYQRKRLRNNKPLSKYLIAISNNRSVIIPTIKVMSLITTKNWNDDTAASKIVPSRVEAVKKLKLSYSHSANMKNEEIKEFINNIIELIKSQNSTIGVELIFEDFLQYSNKQTTDLSSCVEGYIYKLYGGGFDNKVRCLSMSESEAHEEIIQKLAATIINQSPEDEKHKHVGIINHLKDCIDSNLYNHNLEDGNILIGYASEILLYIDINRTKYHDIGNILFYTEHQEQAYNTNIRRLEIMNELTKDNNINADNNICLCMGNPPWENCLDREFFTKIVSAKNFIDGGCVDLIMNASFLRGSGGKTFREFMIGHGSVEEITIFTSNSFLNSSTQEPIGKVGC